MDNTSGLERLSLLARFYSVLRREDGGLNNLRELVDRKVRANLKPEDGVYSFGLHIRQSPKLLIRVYRLHEDGEAHPNHLNCKKSLTSDEAVPVIIFFHGGSFTHSSSSSDIYDTFCRRIVRVTRAVVVSVDYRLAPENKFPCAYDDGLEAVKWVQSRQWLRSGKDLKVLTYLVGDSSGANIVHNVSLRAVQSGRELMGNVLINPMFGGEERTDSERALDGKFFVTTADRDWYSRAFLPVGENRDHPSLNPFGPRGVSLVGVNFPKSLVVASGLDILRDRQLAYARGVEEAGKQVKLIYLEKATVGFYLFPTNNGFDNLILEEIKSFVCPDS